MASLLDRQSDCNRKKAPAFAAGASLHAAVAQTNPAASKLYAELVIGKLGRRKSNCGNGAGEYRNASRAAMQSKIEGCFAIGLSLPVSRGADLALASQVQLSGK